MVNPGRVIGGHYLNAPVTTVIGSELVVQSGLKWRKLNAEQVAAWDDVSPDSKTSTASAVGQAVVGAVLPRFMSKAESAAVGATMDNTLRAPHTVRVDWADGKQSLIKLPASLFAHFELMLGSRRVTSAEHHPISTDVATAVQPVAPGTLAEQALTHLSDIVKARLPRRAAGAGPAVTPGTLSDVTEQITKLSALRDAGVLTEEEFVAKKTELLARL